MKYLKICLLLLSICIIFAACTKEKIINTDEILESNNQQYEEKIELLNQELDNVQQELNNVQKELNNKEQEYQILIEDNNQLKSELTVQVREVSNDDNISTDVVGSNEQIRELRGNRSDGILLYGSEYTSMVPAYGPLAILNPDAINSENLLNILEEGEYITKVEVVGYIPTCYIVKDDEDTISNSYGEMYVIEDCTLNTLPNNDEAISQHLDKGTAVQLKLKSGDWYYVQLYVVEDANQVYWGWIHKDNLGNLSDFESIMNLQVHVKCGATAIDGNSETVICDNDLWGEIIEERDDSYLVSFPGAWFLEVKKSDVRFIEE